MSTRILDESLREISAELSLTIMKLGVLSRRSRNLGRRVFTKSEILNHADLLAVLARNEHQARRLREELIPTDQFGEPGWDLLLDMFAHSIVHKEIPVSSAQIAAHCAPTTAIRYIESLESEGMITRRKSETDGRVVYLSLTDAAIVSVGTYLMNMAGLCDPDT